MPVKIVRSGNRISLKVTAPITTLLESIRAKDLQPMKGSKNPPHLQTKLPKWLVRKITGQ